MTKIYNGRTLRGVFAMLLVGCAAMAFGAEETFYYPAQEAAMVSFSYTTQGDSMVIDFASTVGHITGVTFSASGMATAAQYICQVCNRIDREDCWTFPYESHYVFYVVLEIAGDIWRGGWDVDQLGEFSISQKPVNLWPPGSPTYSATRAVVRCILVDFGTQDFCVGSGVGPLSREGGEFLFYDDIEIVVTYDVAVPDVRNTWGEMKALYRR